MVWRNNLANVGYKNQQARKNTFSTQKCTIYQLLKIRQFYCMLLENFHLFSKYVIIYSKIFLHIHYQCNVVRLEYLISQNKEMNKLHDSIHCQSSNQFNLFTTTQQKYDNGKICLSKSVPFHLNHPLCNIIIIIIIIREICK